MRLVKGLAKQRVIAAGIMAHNEEKVIEKCIESLLSQDLGGEYELEIEVVANACTDRTCEIVLRKCQDVNNLRLIEVKEKGKSHAIRVFKNCVKEWNENQRNGDKRIDKLLFMDADVRLVAKDAVYLMGRVLDSRSDLSAILPFGIPDAGVKMSAFISRLYAAKTNLALAVKGTAFSGQCYMIRNEVAQRIEIPDYIMLDDFYISQRLRKGYVRDYDIRYFYSVPPGFRGEINKILRHSLGNAQMRSFFGRGLFAQPVVDKAAPIEKGLYERRALLKKLWKLPWDQKGFILLFYLISKIGDFRGKLLVKRYGPKNIKFYLEQWQTIR
jgi:glycosyltransferase involved in cell wall biosynthesis